MRRKEKGRRWDQCLRCSETMTFVSWIENFEPARISPGNTGPSLEDKT